MGINDGGSTPFDDDSDGLPDAPRPPHERPWRHPSEIGYADYRALPPPDIGRTGRGLVAFALITGCLLLVGLLIVVRPDDGRNNSTDIVRLSSSNLSIASISTGVSTGAGSAPLAVHITETPFLVTTRNAVDTAIDDRDHVEIQLANGDPATAHVVIGDERLVVLAIAEDVTPSQADLPFSFGVSNGQLVTVALTSGDASFVVEEFEVDTARGTMTLRSLTDSSAPDELVEGAPVVDRTGRFVGFVSVNNGRTLLVPADSAARLLERMISSDGGSDAMPPTPTTP